VVTAKAVDLAPPKARVDAGDESFIATRRNHRRALAVTAAPGLVVLVVLVVVGLATGYLPEGAVAGVVVGAGVSVALWRGASSRVLRALGATKADEDDIPGPFTQVEGLCASMGLGVPDLYLVDETIPGAMAVGRAPARGALVLTSGLLELLDPVALEGVLAHELAHVKRNDIAPATAAAALALRVPWPGSSAAAMVHRAAGHGREMQTDVQAVRVTRYPPGLRHALVAMSAADASHGPWRARRAGQVTRWLWTVVLPDAAGGRPAGEEAIGQLDLPAVRIAALDEW